MIFLVGGPVLFADAAIYKWKDENGKTYFTDDPTKVPEAFRKKPFIKDPKFRKKFPIFRKKKAPDEAGKTSHEKGLAETENKEGDKQEGLTDAERATAEAADTKNIRSGPPTKANLVLFKKLLRQRLPKNRLFGIKFLRTTSLYLKKLLGS